MKTIADIWNSESTAPAVPKPAIAPTQKKRSLEEIWDKSAIKSNAELKQEDYDKAAHLGVVPRNTSQVWTPHGIRAVQATRDSKIEEEFNKNQKLREENKGELPKVGALEQAGRLLKEPERLPFIGMAFDIDKAVRYRGILNRLEKGQTVSKTELMELSNMADYMSRDKTGFAKAIDIGAQSLTFGTEVGLSLVAEAGTAGLATPAVAAGAVTRTGAKAIARELFERIVLKGGKQIIDKEVKRLIAEKGLSAATKTLAKNATREVVEAGLRTAVREQPRVIADMVRDRAGEVNWSTVEQKEKDKFTAEVTKKDDSGVAYDWLKKTVGMSIEGASEALGRLALPAKLGAENILSKSIIGNAIVRANEKFASTAVMKVLNGTLAKIGWDGLIPEIGEEYAASTMHGVASELGIDDTGWQFPKKEDLIPMIASFGAISTLVAGINKYGEYTDEQALKKAQQALVDVTNAAKVGIEQGNQEGVDKMLDEIGFNEDQKKEILAKAKGEEKKTVSPVVAEEVKKPVTEPAVETPVTTPTGEKIVSPEVKSTVIEGEKPIAGEQVEEPKPVEPSETGEVTTPASTIENAGEAKVVEPIEPTVEPIKEVPEKKTSKIAQSIEQKAIDNKLTTKFSELANYDPITIKDQQERTKELWSTDVEKARKILRGDEPLPSGLKGLSVVIGAEAYLEENLDKDFAGDLALEIANSPHVSETSEAAQIMRLAQEREPDSATSKLAEVKKIREEKASKATKRKKSAIVKEARESIDKINLSKEELSWNKFLDEITC